MKKLWLWGLLVLIGFFMAACSGGGSSNDSSTPTPDGFTAEMLDASPTYYVTYADDDNGSELGTTQETIVFSGTGPYKLTLTEEHFDANNVFVSSEIFPVDVTLNQDGTLTATDSSGVTIVTLTSETSTYLAVNGVNGADTWSDLWYFAKPAGWLTASP